jgi:hypothetical protein
MSLTILTLIFIGSVQWRPTPAGRNPPSLVSIPERGALHAPFLDSLIQNRIISRSYGHALVLSLTRVWYADHLY